MPTSLNENEERALIGACLGVDSETQEVMNFVVIAHIHDSGKRCRGTMITHSNSSRNMALTLIESAIDEMGKEMFGEEMLPPRGPIGKLIDRLRKHDRK